MNAKDHFQHLYELISKLTFSEMSIFELMSFANQACALAYQKDANGNHHACLHDLKKIKEDHIRPLLEEELILEERQLRFAASQKNLAQILKVCAG